MAEYGIPYMGSKSSICNELIKVFPRANNFYDLFGGGFSVTNAMIDRRVKDYKTFHFNELRPGICDLVKKAIAGEFNNKVFKPKWISREEFFEKYETDAYIKCLWSFGNNGKTYLFSKEIEQYKRSMHNAIVFNEFDELAEKTLGMKSFKEGLSIYDKRLFLRNRIEDFRINKIPEFLWPFIKDLNHSNQKQLQQLEQLERLQRLQQLQQQQQLERLERLQRLTFYNLSYDQVPILDNSIIYCDPPYAGTADYQNSFSTTKFLEWAANQYHPVFISEYNIPDKRFHCVFKIAKRSMLAGSISGDRNKEEKVYANEPARKAFIRYAMEKHNG